MDNDALMLWMDEKFTALDKRISDIDKNIVGQDRCEEHRRDGVSHCRAVNAKFNTRLCEVEKICFGYEAVKEQIVDGADLQEAKESAINIASANFGQLDTRVRRLEDKSRLIDLTWDTVKNNTVLKAAFTGLALAVSLPALGRWNEGVALYGLHSMVIGASIFLVGLILLWAFMNRAATRKLLKG
jgi:hypothetical protein